MPLPIERASPSPVPDVVVTEPQGSSSSGGSAGATVQVGGSVPLGGRAPSHASQTTAPRRPWTRQQAQREQAHDVKAQLAAALAVGLPQVVVSDPIPHEFPVTLKRQAEGPLAAESPVVKKRVTANASDVPDEPSRAPVSLHKKRLGKGSMTLDLGNLAPMVKPRIDEQRPPDLVGKQLTFSGTRLGVGGNAIVCGIKVDGTDTDAYVVKTARMQTGRLSEGTMASLEDEIAMNREIATVSGGTRLPGVLASSGVAHIENQLCMLMPKVHGGTLNDKITGLYNDAVDGRIEPQDFTARFRDLLRTPMEGLATLHANNIVMNDLNVGNLLFDMQTGCGVVIDFGCAGHVGDHKKPGTVGTIPPERIEACDGASLQPGPHNAPLSEKTDAYAFGAVIHAFVHGDYPTWAPNAREATDERRMLELSLAAHEFEKTGTLFPDGPPIEDGLRRPQARTAEIALRTALKDAGLYDLIDQLMRPDPKQRLSLREALDQSVFFNGGVRAGASGTASA